MNKSLIIIVFIFCEIMFTQIDTIQVTQEQNSRIENLQELAEKYPDAMELQYNLGNALTKAGIPAGAISAYQNSLSLEDNKERAQVFYNLGNSLFETSKQLSQALKNGDGNLTKSQDMMQKSQLALEGSCQSFAQSILLNPDDKDAKWNYEFVKRILEQQEQNQQQSQEKQDGDKKDRQQENQQQQNSENDEEQQGNEENQQQEEQNQDQSDETKDQNPSKQQDKEEMSADEVERLLQAMEQTESDQMKQMMKQRIKTGTPGKDW